MAPLPNHHVIPTGWAAAHRPVAVSTMTGVGDLHAADLPPRYPATEPTPGPRYATALPCRVQQLEREQDATAAGQQVTTRQYLVTLPVSEVPAVGLALNASGPWFTLTGYLPGRAQDGDPSLVGRALKVISIQRGTLLWERDLICEDDLTNGG